MPNGLYDSSLYLVLCITKNRYGEKVIRFLVNDDIMDDGQLFLQWCDTGYVVVPFTLGGAQDAQLGANEAYRILDLVAAHV